LGILAIVVSERRFKDGVWFAVGASALGLLGGMLDWLTWGKPFYALKKYLYFNLKKSGAKFGRYPFSYYATVTWSAVGPAALVLAGAFVAGLRLAPKLGLLVLAYVGLHSLIPHKEYRFLMPVVPFGLALAGCGLANLAKQLRAPDWLATVTGVVCAAAMAYATTQLTWSKLGFPSDRGERSPWHSGEGINRLLWAAGQRDDVCGLMVTGESFGWIGGYSYFHRDANLFPDTQETTQGAANYLIAPVNTALLAGYVEVDRSRDALLLKRPGGCNPPAPDYRRELPY
jgi:phosphatidylinositol glycan class B